jgi:hypothetical protein
VELGFWSLTIDGPFEARFTQRSEADAGPVFKMRVSICIDAPYVMMNGILGYSRRYPFLGGA